MKIIILDGSKSSREILKSRMKNILSPGRAELVFREFEQYEDVLNFIRKHRNHVVFANADCETSGAYLFAKECRNLNLRQNIIFYGEKGRYLRESWKLKLSGYLPVPYSDDELRMELEDLRYPPEGKYDPPEKKYCAPEEKCDQPGEKSAKPGERYFRLEGKYFRPAQYGCFQTLRTERDAGGKNVDIKIQKFEDGHCLLL